MGFTPLKVYCFWELRLKQTCRVKTLFFVCVCNYYGFQHPSLRKCRTGLSQPQLEGVLCRLSGGYWVSANTPYLRGGFHHVHNSRVVISPRRAGENTRSSSWPQGHTASEPISAQRSSWLWGCCPGSSVSHHLLQCLPLRSSLDCFFSHREKYILPLIFRNDPIFI